MGLMAFVHGRRERHRERRQIKRLLSAVEHVREQPENAPRLHTIDLFEGMLSNLAMYADFYEEVGNARSAASLRSAYSEILTVHAALLRAEDAYQRGLSAPSAPVVDLAAHRARE